MTEKDLIVCHMIISSSDISTLPLLSKVLVYALGCSNLISSSFTKLEVAGYINCFRKYKAWGFFLFELTEKSCGLEIRYCEL